MRTQVDLAALLHGEHGEQEAAVALMREAAAVLTTVLGPGDDRTKGAVADLARCSSAACSNGALPAVRPT